MKIAAVAMNITGNIYKVKMALLVCYLQSPIRL